MGAKKFIVAWVLMRSKILWINSERVFKTMALHLNLVATLARALINQLLDESLLGSELFGALVLPRR